MNLFYAPDIVTSEGYTLTEEESKHCIRVLRMGAGDRINITDGRGNMHTAEITGPDPKRCTVRIVETIEGWGRRGYSLTMAVAPTKNLERYEWFLEKATEVGCDIFIPVECERSERRVIKPERGIKVITSALKQSFGAYHPVFEPMAGVRVIMERPFAGVKLIAHCGEPVKGRSHISECIKKGDDVLILIGPEGDFTSEEVEFAVACGFAEITLGASRLRTETAALYAAIETAVVNR